MNISDLYQIYLAHSQIITDTRKIKEGNLFFALRGENFDANSFAETALEKGAAFAVIDNLIYKKDERYILVNDTLIALQELAKYHREQLKIPVIGLTGSNGKTTTKELINSVLSQKFKTLATTGNLNNHIGVPLTLLEIDASHEIAIIEMGANHQKEIEMLCEICQPNYGLITNIGKAHLEGFGGVEGIKKGKGELFDFLEKHSGTAFINKDSDVLTKMVQQRNLASKIYYGKSHDNDVSGELISNQPYLEIKWKHKDKENHQVLSQLTGTYNFENILAAIAIALNFGLSPDEINKGIKNYQPQNNRSQITKTIKNTVVCDFYNANPSSMLVAIENINQLKADKKILILGDMYELGDETELEHLNIITKAFSYPFNEIIFIGDYFYKQKQDLKNVVFFESTRKATDYLKEKNLSDALVLVKGSRGMKLESLMEFL
ncbi:UDP-N-acetylmuramoyl-tripeptide--D-alanyl-D-alanine ligase [Pedobacter psychrophilus]|uniref:UDP-N-acetylmuramoyl-tripeptide--D-alanyl-D-alanine ligase n=1 Tax=Pedobacter psychrophilus TaxID=1826909 RepID=A0A179DLF1_9SPHI|nr:UDP-N-acetylmuramoyl-tripeptide--D-alanyl-D-alanine ligase [Pedobacter psychrophilus]OAQ41612.1 UDP-N-acetylmuramoyl-tripeptide--D-alanyl-D-alanine ligase [Pedobacter psychrophilus]